MVVVQHTFDNDERKRKKERKKEKNETRRFGSMLTDGIGRRHNATP
jgi:hypothetical protein